jgi:hypothetical protein
MKSLRNDLNNLFDNTHEQIEIYQEFYHSMIYIANEGHHVPFGIDHLTVFFLPIATL